MAAHIAHANARIGTVLLATAVNHLEETPEEVIAKVRVEVERNSWPSEATEPVIHD
ncbi:hypothetical protein [Streptomyces rubiginosohelvolus]|uniref:hypothetical protein n=1 Tax=Streptomyces rubiginosohelvolus TaxID=67362 RepID=UPI0035D96363